MTLASFVIKIKADETFDYQGLEKEIYNAVSSNGINMKSIAERIFVDKEFLIPVVEFLAVWVQFLTLKLLISVNTIVRWMQHYQTAKSSSYS